MATPIATYGRDAKVIEAVREKLLPDIDVVHSCVTLESAEAELPLVCAGDLSAPAASGLGSNAALSAAERRVPRVVFFGGGIPEDEFERVAGLVRARAPDTGFLRVTREDVLATGAAGPNPDVIAKIYRDKLAAL